MAPALEEQHRQVLLGGEVGAGQLPGGGAGLRQAFVAHPGMAERLQATTADVRDGRTPASTAARQLLAAFQLRSS